MNPPYNLFTDGVSACAAFVKLRLIRGDGRQSVWVRDNGDLLIEAARHENKRSRALPAHMQVGVYERKVPQTDIADDLEFRLQELLREEAA